MFYYWIEWQCNITYFFCIFVKLNIISTFLFWAGGCNWQRGCWWFIKWTVQDAGFWFDLRTQQVWSFLLSSFFIFFVQNKLGSWTSVVNSDAPKNILKWACLQSKNWVGHIVLGLIAVPYALSILDTKITQHNDKIIIKMQVRKKK